MRQKAAPAVCPVCAEDVPRGALACQECGADHHSGWRDEALIYDGLDLPEENTSESVGGQGGRPRRTLNRVWMAAGATLMALLVLYSLLR